MKTLNGRYGMWGVNAYHADSSAALVKDGQLIAAAEEERFNRIKHWSGFPVEAIKYCLNAGGVTLKDLDYICINRNTSANLLKKIGYVLTKQPSLYFFKDRLVNINTSGNIKEEVCSKFGINKKELNAKFKFVEHHRVGYEPLVLN